MKKSEPKLPDGVTLWEGTVEYMQDSDSNAEDQLGQVIKVSSIVSVKPCECSIRSKEREVIEN